MEAQASAVSGSGDACAVWLPACRVFSGGAQADDALWPLRLQSSISHERKASVRLSIRIHSTGLGERTTGKQREKAFRPHSGWPVLQWERRPAGLWHLWHAGVWGDACPVGASCHWREERRKKHWQLRREGWPEQTMLWDGRLCRLISAARGMEEVSCLCLVSCAWEKRALLWAKLENLYWEK